MSIYRGTRRLGGQRAAPEYFGTGHIGQISRDDTIAETMPKKNWAWYCTIVDYQPFPTPVPAKINGEFIEHIARNHWSVGIRPLPPAAFDRIIALAGITSIPTEPLLLPSLDAVSISETPDRLLLPRRPTIISNASIPDSPTARYSRNAAAVGRRAEELVHRFLIENSVGLGARKIRWIAQEGGTPGWDLQYEDERGNLIAVEVKGTTSPAFPSIDLTVGEWNAAQVLGERYWLYLVAECTTKNPKLQKLQDPARLVQGGGATLLAVVYRFAAVSD